MNMKKSIAAVSAGAMAISAMATVASANVIYHPTNENAAAAREQIVLTYDLSEYVEAFKPTSVKITTTYEGAEYLIKGLDIDKINNPTGWDTKVGSEYGYTVVLGDILKDIQAKNKQYFIQTVELSAWSMDHHNPSIWDDGINGIRNRSKIWYSRASLGRDISDMQNEAAAVEDHSHIQVLVADGSKNYSEYAFQVRFEELAHSNSGDFILNEFKASDSYNKTAGTTTTINPAYTVANALIAKNTLPTDFAKTVDAYNPATKEALKIDYIPDKATAKDYEVVAVVSETTKQTSPKYMFVNQLSTAAKLKELKAYMASPLAAGISAADEALVTANRTRIQASFAWDLSTMDVDALAGAKIYWTGTKWSLVKSDARLYDATDKAAEGLKVDDAYAPTEAGAVAALNVETTALKDYETALNAALADAKATYDKIAFVQTPSAGLAGGPTDTFNAANGYKPYIGEQAENAKPVAYDYYIVKSPAAGVGQWAADILDTTYDKDAYDITYNAAGVIINEHTNDPVHNKYIKVVKADKVAGLDHWKGDKSVANWVYSFNKFIVTSTFTVDYDDWDKADFYTGQGANAKFVPLHNGIGRDKAIIDKRPTEAVYNEESFYGTSSVNFNFPGAYQIIKPMRSTLTSPADVIKALEARKDGGKKYTSPVTVLNDVVGNNEEISFEFVSCSKYVRNTKYVEAVRGRKVKDMNGNDVKTTDNVNLWTVTMVNPTTGENETRMFRGDKFNKSISGDYFGENDSVRVIYDKDVDSKFGEKFFGSVDTKNGGHLDEDWYNPVFGQHLYTNATYGTDNNHSLSTNGTGYALTGPNADGGDQTGNAAYNNAWGANAIGNYGSYNYGGWNTNLFNGGLVINSNWTMQINDSKHFDWGNNSIIFFWSDLTAEVKTHATNFLVAMQLYTPADWYWDTLNVGVGAAAAENVFNGASGEGLENDGEEVVEDDEVEELPEDEEEYFEDFEEEEEPEEEYYEEDDFDDFDDFEEEEEEEPEEVEVEVKEVPSPKTGNSPIALAVIPVALAAAAIVAKKKND